MGRARCPMPVARLRVCETFQQPSFPRRRESAVAGRRWVPVCTGTTGGGGRTHNRHSRDGGNPRRGAGDGFPSARERRAAAGAPTIVIPATAGIRGGGRRWVPVCTGTTGGGGRTHNRHSRDGGNPRWGPAMGSRLHGNDGRRRAHPQSSFPRRRESTAGGRRWVPVCTGTTGGGGVPTIVLPATAGIHGGGPAMGSRLHGNDGRRRAHPQSSFPRRRESAVGAGDGFPSARERRAAAGAPTIVIPATAGIHGGGPAMGSRLHGNDGRRRAHPQSSFPRRRESTAGGRRWVPVCTGTTGGGGRTHNRYSREGGNPGLGVPC